MSFSTAEMAVVAYALVKADGSSPEINSGVGTTYLSGTGTYLITLPGSENVANVSPLQQGQGDPRTGARKDLILVTATYQAGEPGGSPCQCSTLDLDEFHQQITLLSTTEQHQSDFAVVILRPTIPTPTDNSGIQNGPT